MSSVLVLIACLLWWSLDWKQCTLGNNGSKFSL